MSGSYVQLFKLGKYNVNLGVFEFITSDEFFEIPKSFFRLSQQ